MASRDAERRNVLFEIDGGRLGITGRGQRDHATKDDAFAYRYPWLD